MNAINQSFENLKYIVEEYLVYLIKKPIMFMLMFIINLFQLLQGVGFAPPLFATFNNGLAYQYIPGEVLTVETVRSPEIYPHVARRLAQLHRLRLHDYQHEPMLWPALDKFIKLIPQQYSDPDKQKRYES